MIGKKKYTAINMFVFFKCLLINITINKNIFMLFADKRSAFWSNATTPICNGSFDKFSHCNTVFKLFSEITQNKIRQENFISLYLFIYLVRSKYFYMCVHGISYET